MKLVITAAESAKLAEARRLLDGLSASLKDRGQPVSFTVTVFHDEAPSCLRVPMTIAVEGAGESVPANPDRRRDACCS